ncbi:MAG: F0F1 ATP synthase subunit delta [Patescibacteria group bacterium]
MTKPFTRQLARALYAVAQDKKSIELDVVIGRAIALLRARPGIPQTQELLAELERVHREETAGIRAVVTSKVPLSHGLKAELTRVLEHRFKKDVDVDEVMDDSVLGGFRVRVGDFIIDATLTTQIKELTKHLMNA